MCGLYIHTEINFLDRKSKKHAVVLTCATRAITVIKVRWHWKFHQTTGHPPTDPPVSLWLAGGWVGTAGRQRVGLMTNANYGGWGGAENEIRGTVYRNLQDVDTRVSHNYWNTYKYIASCSSALIVSLLDWQSSRRDTKWLKSRYPNAHCCCPVHALHTFIAAGSGHNKVTDL